MIPVTHCFLVHLCRLKIHKSLKDFFLSFVSRKSHINLNTDFTMILQRGRPIASKLIQTNLLRTSLPSSTVAILANTDRSFSSIKKHDFTSLKASPLDSSRFFSTAPLPPTSNHPYTPLSGAKGSLIYTETDEAPALATFSLLPFLQKVSSLFL